MQNKVVIVVVLILALVFAYWYSTGTPAMPTAEQEVANIENNALQSASAGAVDTGGVVAGSVEKANPFGANINPYDGYRNPFVK